MSTNYRHLQYIAEISNLSSLRISQHLINNLKVQILDRNRKFRQGHIHPVISIYLYMADVWILVRYRDKPVS
jgi:hypothetical protein